jgi:hypothetical protein
MLTEEQREIIVNFYEQTIDWKYQDKDINPLFIRSGATKTRKRSCVLFEFSPTSRVKFRSISDVIGNASDKGEYKEYGWCQLEQCVIRTYCFEKHYLSDLVNGRTLAEHMARLAMIATIRNLDGLLFEQNLAFDRSENLGIIFDKSIFDPTTKMYNYIYEINFMIRTHFRWNYIPSDHEGDVICESINLKYKSNNEDNYRYRRITIE